MARPDDSIFSHVLSAFRLRMSPQDISDFQSTTVEDLKAEITAIQRKQAQSRGFRNLNRVRPFLNGIEQYSKVIEVFVNAKPDIMAFIWGPMKLCLQIASKLTEAFDALLDAYERIGKCLPLFSKIESLFLSQSYVTQVLVDVYEDILDFHKRAINFFKQSTWRLAFKVTIHTFADMFGDVVKKLERSKELLLHSADIAHYQEAQEFRLRFAREFEAQLEETRKKRMLTVIDWLSPTSCDVDHEELQQKRDEFPDTTRWIFTQKSMRHWLQPDGKSNPIFWICGIPGAGKTVLFSSIVDQINKSIPHSQVIFFYCKNLDPLRKTFDGIARSLIAQLLRLNPVSLDYLHDTAVDSGEQHPTTFKTYRGILEHITSAHDFLFIGIDGLDECERDDRRLILSLLDHVLKASNPQANIKVFLASQRMSDLEKSSLLKPALRFDIKHQHVKQDIENYVHTRTLQLCKKFDFDLEQQSSISADISSRSEGMFLLARLIMDNLMVQDNIEELEEELSTDILPKGINQAYGRILVRLNKSPNKSQDRVTRILELIITARYPLKVQELQGALSIRLEDRSVEFAKRRTLTSFTELCGPIVEVHADDTISLVHPTAKQYLVQDHSGPFINLRASHIRMANLCAQYLNFECFSTLHELENQVFVAAGAYAFQEYATLNWIYHAQLIFKPGTSYEGGEHAALIKSCSLLILIHRELLSEQQQALSLENIDLENQDFRAELSLLRKTYESIHSISDDDHDKDLMPHPLRHLSQTRSIIEGSFTTANSSYKLMTEAYGPNVFKCSVLSCPGFRRGYKTSRIRDEHQVTHRALHLAASKGHENVVRLLLEHGADVNAETRRLGTALIQAAKNGHLSIVKSLLERNADVNQTNSAWETALHLAASDGHENVVHLLLEHGADVNAETLHLETVLTQAAKNGHLSIVESLLERSADVNRKDSGGKTALHWAASDGHENVVHLLLEHGADVNAETLHLETVLIQAAKNGHLSIVKSLLERNADVNQTNSDQETALHWAASSGHENVVGLLLEQGADSTLKNVWGQSPQDLAHNCGYWKLANFLEANSLRSCEAGAAEEGSFVSWPPEREVDISGGQIFNQDSLFTPTTPFPSAMTLPQQDHDFLPHIADEYHEVERQQYENYFDDQIFG